MGRYYFSPFDDDDRDGYRARGTRAGSYPHADSNTQPDPCSYHHTYAYAYTHTCSNAHANTFTHTGTGPVSHRYPDA